MEEWAWFQPTKKNMKKGAHLEAVGTKSVTLVLAALIDTVSKLMFFSTYAFYRLQGKAGRRVHRWSGLITESKTK